MTHDLVKIFVLSKFLKFIAKYERIILKQLKVEAAVFKPNT